MGDRRLGRREFALASASALGAIAGCTAPQAGGQSIGDPTDPGEDGDAPDVPDDAPPSTGESAYSSVYEQIVDSVTLVRVFGVDEPTGGETRGQGSAFVYDEDHVVTNEHVVAAGDDVELQYTSGDWTEARIVGTDGYSDLAVLAVEDRPSTADPLPFATSEPTVGDEVLAVGNPYGLEGSMSAGIVSGVNRTLAGPTAYSIPNTVQTDAAVNPGNSGGPLVNLDGEVVGVVSAGGGDNLGFAISAALAGRVVSALVDDGAYGHSYLGVTLVPIDPLLADANDLPEPTGVLVVGVDPEGPSADVLRGSDETVDRRGEVLPVGGDVVLGLDGEPTPDRHALAAYLALETSPGDTVDVEIRRDGERETVEVSLGTRPAPS